MSKVLFVRGFDQSLHEKLTDQAKKEGISAASILEEAYQDWIKKRKEVSPIHHLVLYSDEKSLMNFIKKVKEILDDDWLQVCCGSESNNALKFLKKRGWFDVTISPYIQGIKDPENYSSKVFDRLGSIAAGKQACFMGFMTEDVAKRYSLNEANKVERIYNKKRISGVTFCPYDVTKLSNFNLKDLLELIGHHDKVYLLKENEVFELNVSKSNFAKLFI